MTDTVDPVGPTSGDDQPAREDEAPSITELLVELGHDVSVLVLCESQLAASRHMPEVRRAARDIVGALVAAIAFATAFGFANVAIFFGLSSVMPNWVAALILCAGWVILGGSLALALMVRAGNVTGWKWWRLFSASPEESRQDLEQARADAERGVRDTLARLAPAMTIEIASASVAVAGDVAGDVLDVGEDMLEASDDMVEAIADGLPGGSVVNQMWDVVLMPGRFGIKVATTVLKRN